MIVIILCLLALNICILFIYIYNYATHGVCKCSIHLTNKVVIVTGANSGIGLAVAKDLAERGARLIIACRNEKRAVHAVKEIKKVSRNEDVHYRYLDLASLTSVRNFASGILQSEKRLDILINNAGTYTGANDKTEDGFSLINQCNYLGPFLLTSLLLPLLRTSAPSRIINLSSMTHSMVFSFDPDKLNNVPGRINTFTNTFCYFRTKLCINLMTFELSRRLKGTGITVNCLHPGAVKTNLLNNIDLVGMKLILKIFFPFFKSPWEGAQTVIYLAVSPKVESCSGGYYKDCKLTNASRHSQNTELAQKLWETTQNLLCNNVNLCIDGVSTIQIS